MNHCILHSDVQHYIQENLDTDTNGIALSKSPFKDVTSRELAEQIDSKKRCEKKLPLWFSTPNIYYPPKLSVEQASSEATARFKATLARGQSILDLTGGFGVDSHYFAKSGLDVIHSEINANLSAIASYNSTILKSGTISYHSGDGLELIGNGKYFDTIYIDPSRRVNAQKVFKLKECMPDVPGNLSQLFLSCSRLIVKTSPLLDLQAGFKELKNVKYIYIISVKNDCKELLWVMEPDHPADVEPVIICHISDDEEQDYRFKTSDERAFQLTQLGEPQTYLYEPDVALLKGGCFKLLCRDFSIDKLHLQSHLYTSGDLKKSFPGRTFTITAWGEYKGFMRSNIVQKANIISRNFPLSPSDIKKRHKLADGGDDFLIFTTGPSGQLLTILARKTLK